ncbi:MAG: sulfatase-like hydrolase/transferase [Lentisphaerae bacterium]|jgi:arylsulfatase|nr:sulfatase-like hydrolase/transferase [Lentisphaerota bacterium]MBT4821960.1 sulfatase-like hydrolase/transferase [Lentisphaerota bacterium]MBT5605764.1 sulfatase-like hydrolase/transferase [Lentisphaerota bacterium]MBT7053913.1 sulfatase-like hydrolase/transferase [Lentisphaerota bacterium]MBT7843945.1 sulfatase-like hydrolase/transferase [Lentisphaerota bacterium]
MRPIADRRPNVVMILADQFRHDVLGTLGHPVVETPNLDRLADDGVLFSNAYCGTMACGPSRASLFTGLHSDAHGQLTNQIDLWPPDIPVLPELLADAGYDTALVGKLHLKPMSRRFGFRYCLRHDAPYTNYSREEAADSAYVKYLQTGPFKDDPEGVVRRFTEDEACFPDRDQKRFILGSNIVTEEDHEVPWAVRESINYVRNERDKRKPFFLNTSFYGPHQPMLCPGRWERLYPPDELPLPPGFSNPVGDKPIMINRFRDLRERDGWSETDYRDVFSAYYGYIAMIDHYLGRLFEALKQEGLWDNTIVIFTADHGDYMGQFRRFFKGGGGYEGSTHVPLIIRDPRNKQRGRRCSRNVSGMDLFRTCLVAAGAAVPPDTDARDLTPLVGGQGDGWDNTVLWKANDESMIVRDRHKLMRAARNGTVHYEFYDLGQDPWEAVNRAEDPLFAAQIREMRAELDAWHAEQDSLCRDKPKPAAY